MSDGGTFLFGISTSLTFGSGIEMAKFGIGIENIEQWDHKDSKLNLGLLLGNLVATKNFLSI